MLSTTAAASDHYRRAGGQKKGLIPQTRFTSDAALTLGLERPRGQYSALSSQWATVGRNHSVRFRVRATAGRLSKSMRRDDLLDLNDVLQHPGRTLAVDVSTELPEEADLDLLTPIEGFLEAVSTGNVLLVTGEFTTRAVVECARCTGPLEMDLKFEIDEQFTVEGTPSSLSLGEMAKVVADEPFPLFEGNQLIVEALVRQALLLAVPVQPLCSFGWDGPCPQAEERGISIPEPPAVRPEFEGLGNLLRPETDGDHRN